MVPLMSIKVKMSATEFHLISCPFTLADLYKNWTQFLYFKEACCIFPHLVFFSNFWDFDIKRKPIFFSYPKWFYLKLMFHLEDIAENMTSNVNQLRAQQQYSNG